LAPLEAAKTRSSAMAIGPGAAPAPYVPAVLAALSFDGDPEGDRDGSWDGNWAGA
jgi:hypothetical protein